VTRWSTGGVAAAASADQPHLQQQPQMSPLGGETELVREQVVPEGEERMAKQQLMCATAQIPVAGPLRPEAPECSACSRTSSSRMRSSSSTRRSRQRIVISFDCRRSTAEIAATGGFETQPPKFLGSMGSAQPPLAPLACGPGVLRLAA